MRIEAFETDGSSAGAREVGQPPLQAGTVTLRGKQIARVTVESPGWESALLHEICFECPAAAVGTGGEVEIRALRGEAVVSRTVVRGNAGQVVAATLEAAGITAVEMSGGKAALVDLCVWPSRQEVTFGWDEVPGFQYPLCLPVAHADYPCSSKPATVEEAQALAFSRVTYPAPDGWNKKFPDLHGQLEILVKGGPGGGPMAGRVNPDLIGAPLGPAPGLERLKVPKQRPLDLVFLASLQPAMAQMLGLYFADTSAEVGVPYDYLLLADPTGVLGGSAATALEWLAFTIDLDAVDGYLATGKSIPSMPAPPVPPPGPARAYALPGAIMRSQTGDLVDAQANAGLWWQPPPPKPTGGGTEQPNRPVLYYPWRASLGLNRPPPTDPPPPDAKYHPVLRPADPQHPTRPPRPLTVLLAAPTSPPTNPTPSSPEWPPPPISFHIVDSGLAEGWYSYRIVGQDIFGRHSALGSPAEWYQWDPPHRTPPVPLPWYYEKGSPGHHSIHPFAVALLDKIPPPRPTGLEATCLDPFDRWVLRDEPYETWRADHPTAVGLRVRWRWILAHMNQAPDTREFRLYYQPGRLNALQGKALSVAAASPTESDVGTDLARPFPAGVLAGGRLQVDKDSFEIVDNNAGAPVRLRVKNLGEHGTVRPVAGKPCILFPDLSRSTAWAKRLSVVGYNEHVTPAFEISRDPKGQNLTAPEGATASAQTVHLAGTLASPGVFDPLGVPDLSGVQPWLDHLHFDGDTAHPGKLYRILGVGPLGATVTIDEAPALGAMSPWTIGRPARDYEVFLEPPVFAPGAEFEPTLADPTVFAQIGISAADDKIHTEDDPHWGMPPSHDRFGNEGRVGGPAAIFRVLQTPPDPPELPDYPDRLVATPADYHSDSFFTFRWKVPEAGLKVHVLRALDDSLFQRDLLIRETREALDPVLHLDHFPEAWKLEPDPAARRQAAATKVKGIEKEADYLQLSDDAWKVLALLPGNEGISSGIGPEGPAATQRLRSALSERDWAVRSTRKVFLATAPPSFSSSTLAAYEELLDPALRTLAGLPGNEDAFAQITLEPLDDSTEPAISDRRGPDDLEPPGYQVRPDVRAYLDTLPGRATNRYFYRAVCVDGAHNRSGLSLSTPPVYLPDLVLPATPLIQSALSGSLRVVLQWKANTEPGLRRYLIYRTESRENGRDLRLMGVPVADLTATTLVAVGGAVDMATGTEVVRVQRVYQADGFDPSADLLVGQTAPQYLAAPTVPAGALLTGLTALDGTEVVVVYQDAKGGLQVTPHGKGLRIWTDQGLVGAHTYYYRIVATRKADGSNGEVILHSLPSNLIAARAVDLTLPDPPVITTIEWVRVGEDGRLYSYSSPVPEGAIRLPAAHLVWASPDPRLTCLVQFRSEPGGSYVNASKWLAIGEYEYVHPNEFGFQEQAYRLKVLDRAGNANVDYATAVLSAAP